MSWGVDDSNREILPSFVLSEGGDLLRSVSLIL